MQKVTLKRAGIAASVFFLGWYCAVGYLSWQYDVDFSPWQKDEASVLPLTQAIFRHQCTRENPALTREAAKGDKAFDAFSAAWFGCLSDRSDALMHSLSLAVTGYSDLSCRMKTESEGRPDDACKKALDERILMHRALKEFPAE